MHTRFVITGQPPPKENSTPGTKSSKIGFVLVAALLGTLTGCVGYVDGPRDARVCAPLPPAYVESVVVVQDDYIYYPGYEVYYGGHTRQYVYRDGRSWVSRSSPPRVSANVLFASPSVRLDFHDSPSFHHAATVQRYPRNWAPPGWSQGNQRGRGQDQWKGY